MNEEKMEKFLHNHQIKILNDQKRYQRYHRIPTYFDNIEDYNAVVMDTIFKTEKLYTVEIPESELHRLAEFEHDVFKHMASSGTLDIFNMLIDQKEEEKSLREQFPSVQKAYEHYSLMLTLAKSGRA
jgi:hypothetical protein